MEPRDPNYSDVVALMPQQMRQRFVSLGGYVQAVVNEEEEGMPRGLRLSRESVQTLKLAVLVFTLEHLFREGSRAARSAVREFERLDLPGFQVGSQTFEGENENVVRGDKLAMALRDAFSRESVIATEIGRAHGVRDLVVNLGKRLRYGREDLG